MNNAVAVEHHALIERGKKLEYFTLSWCGLEAIVGIIAGFMAGSVSLTSFGLDSVIEVTSGTALLWRFHRDSKSSNREKAEQSTLHIVGFCFLALAIYIAYDSASSLIRHELPEKSIPGIILALSSVVVMPLLARAKRHLGNAIGSGAMNADARQADFCSYLSAILLGGLVVYAAFGLWWADSIGALLMVPIIAKEGIDALRSRACCGSQPPSTYCDSESAKGSYVPERRIER
jgi:divalent metal cation (Fe/Co/Zn/Cd) transporter